VGFGDFVERGEGRKESSTKVERIFSKPFHPFKLHVCPKDF